MTPKKVLCIINSISAGGAEQVLQNILRYYNRDCLSLEICVLHKTGKERFLIVADVPIHYLYAESWGWYAGALIRFIVLTVRIKPSLLFSSLVKSNIIAAIAGWLTGIPVVMSEHGPTHLYINDYAYPCIARAIMKMAYTSARNIIAVSQAGKESILSVFPKCRERIMVIHNGIDIDEIQKKAAFAQFIIRTPYVVACGRLSPEKNFSLLIESVAALNTTYSLDYPLCIIGEGSQREELTHLARQRGVRLTLPGFIDNPYPIIAGGKAFVMTSFYESFPLVALEAMACRTTVVAINSPGGIREVLRDGENCLIPAGVHPQEIAESLNRILTDTLLDQCLTQTAANDVKKHFSVQLMIHQYDDILSRKS
ncbi:MAG: glycosyltransferase [Elusimicrobiota bacterium]